MSGYNFKKNTAIFCLKIFFTFTNSVDPDEIQHYAAFHLSLHYLHKYLYLKLELDDLNFILRERRLRWFGHVERSSGAVRIAGDVQIDGSWGQGGPS